MDALVSVLMCVHNESIDFINVAVNSILNQSYQNLEFIIIDDKSTKEVSTHLDALQKQSTIIQVFHNYNNLGLTASLNKGLKLSTGKYIARMDADDYSCPERIAKQVEYLEQNSDIAILGTGVVSFGDKVSFMSPMNGYSPEDVMTNLFFTSSLCHPSVMMRKSFLEENGLQYDEEVKKGQDFDLWERSSIYGKLAVLQEVLLYYRLHPKQITSTNRSDQDISAERIMLRRINRLGIQPTQNELLAHKSLRNQKGLIDIREISSWIDKLIKASENKSFVNTDKLTKNLHQRLAAIKIKEHKILRPKECLYIYKAFLYRLKMNSVLKQYTQEIERAIKQ